MSLSETVLLLKNNMKIIVPRGLHLIKFSRFNPRAETTLGSHLCIFFLTLTSFYLEIMVLLINKGVWFFLMISFSF